MAISTPAQKPRGDASSTRSTSITTEATQGLRRIRSRMSAPRVVAVAPGSAAAQAGVAVGDEVLSLNGQVPRDIIQWRFLGDDADVDLEVRRAGLTIPLTVSKRGGEPLGAEVSSALFDQVRTC